MRINFFNLPTLLTWVRIAVIPVMLGLYYWAGPGEWDSRVGPWSAILFLLAAFTDWLDGWLARHLGQQSAFGAFLDPVADKLLVTAALIILVQEYRCEAWIALIIIGREIAISALREWMARLGLHGSVAVNALGKIKTFAQMASIPLLLWGNIGDISLLSLGTYGLRVAAVLTLVSMVYYLKGAMDAIRQLPRTAENKNML